MRLQELLENTTPGEYVYHASYLPNLTKGLQSVISRGLTPSKEGYAGPGVYFAYDPEGGYYHVSKEDATLFRVKWSDLANKFGTYPSNPNGIERDADEIIVPGAVPASMLEVEFFPGEWWDLESALASSRGPVDESDEPTRIKIGGGNEAAKAWIEKVYAKYPHTMQNNHVMIWGEGDAQQFAMFELTPSFSKRGAVEVKWFQAYPLRQGVGSKAMKELQTMARADGIALTLFPWDKGQVSQSKLTKFYKGQGFAPIHKGSKSMAWETVEEAESYQPPTINVGDEVKVGKFKNRRAEVKGFTTDKNNQPVLKTDKGDQQLFKPRISKLMKEEELTELFDPTTSFPLEWDEHFANQGEVHAQAYDADGRTIGISFTPAGNGEVTDIVFSRGGSYDVTGKGDAARVMSTVINAIKIFVEKYKPPYLAFSAKTGGGRASAYAAMIKRVARGYQLLQPDQYPEELEGYLEFIGKDQPFILARQ